jgi:hypothetical protein
MAHRSPNTYAFMETKTAFDLNTAIQRWREHLSQSPQFRPENLEELEVHLRDSVAALRDNALSEEEAFLVATRRIGGVPALAPEFAKVNGREVWMNRLLWMLVGAQLWPMVRICAGTFADATVMGALLGFGRGLKFPNGNPGFQPLPVVLLMLVNALALTGCLAAGWWVLRRNGRNLANTAAVLLRRPVFVPILACLTLSLVLGSFGVVKAALLHKWLPFQSIQGIDFTMSLASSLYSLVVAIALIVLTVLLARRQLRSSTNS